MNSSAGKLYLVPTPIGNMDDISLRAIQVLKEVNMIACEDTRHSGRLLKKLKIKKKLISYHNFNERKRAETLVDEMKTGLSIAVISDAGSPGISDPAYRIVIKAIENEITVVPLPGANSLVPALTASGLPPDSFFYGGFLPPKKSGRIKKFESLIELSATLIFFESPHRIEKAVAEACQVFGNRPACIAREMTKLHEEFIRLPLNELKETLTARKLKGEIVFLISGKK